MDSNTRQPPASAHATSLTRLGDELDTLASEAATLRHELERLAASEARRDLARDVLPLSTKGSPQQRTDAHAHYLAVLRRRRIRLQREGAAIAARLDEINRRVQALRQDRADAALYYSAMRDWSTHSLAQLRDAVGRLAPPPRRIRSR